MGWDAGMCRLPLVELDPEHKELLSREMRAAGLI